MGVQLTTKSVTFYEDSEAVTIQRYVLGGADGLSRTATTIYTGPGDFQLNTGDTYTDAGGIVASADGVLVIDKAGLTALPVVDLGDVVTVNGTSYTVVLVQTWTFSIPHLELFVRIGTRYQAPR